MSSVELKGVVKSYQNNIPVVHGIDLSINDGEFMVLVGPSGCGKSTTLRMIAGLEEITDGKLLIGDKVVNNIAPKDRNIAMVFQNYALYPHMTVYENIAFGLKLAKLPKAEINERVRSVAKNLEIDHLLDRKPKNMSGGQRQRVALGRAIARRSSVYLFDEPLSNLDAQLRVSMRVRLAQLHTDLKKQGLDHTMIYVTHDQVEAMTLGHRICVMENGYIRQVDTPINLYKYPANKFVAEFIGSPSMNFTYGILEKEDNKYIININNYKLIVPIECSTQLEKYIGRKLGVGVRAENIFLDINNADYGPQVEIAIIENMGNEELVYFNFNDTLFVCRSQNSLQSSPEHCYIKFEANGIHLFDLETELNISLPKERIPIAIPKKNINTEDILNVISWLGGKENILDNSYCISRVRFIVKNISQVDKMKFSEQNFNVIYADDEQIHAVCGENTKLVFDSFQKELG